MLALDESSTLGARAPGPAQRLAIVFSRATPVARGYIRKHLGKWVGRSGPVDYELFGKTFRFYPQHSSGDRKALMAPQTYDLQERQHIVRLAQSSTAERPFTFVDIGASVGIYTLFVATQIANARVLALEPFSPAYRKLHFNVDANGLDNVDLRNVAAGDKTGKAMFSEELESMVFGTKTVEVATDTLLNLIQAAGFDHIDALKIDVEGFEDHILVPYFAAAAPALYPRMVIIEHVSRDDWEQDCIALLETSGYSLTARTTLNSVYERH